MIIIFDMSSDYYFDTSSEIQCIIDLIIHAAYIKYQFDNTIDKLYPLKDHSEESYIDNMAILLSIM